MAKVNVSGCQGLHEAVEVSMCLCKMRQAESENREGHFSCQCS